MQKQFNLEVIIVSIATLVLLLTASISEAREENIGLHNAVYEWQALQHTPSKFSKASHFRYNGNRYHRYRSNRNYYRGNRYYRGGNSYYRSNRHYYRGNRYYYPRYRNYGHRNYYRHRYGH